MTTFACASYITSVVHGVECASGFSCWILPPFWKNLRDYSLCSTRITFLFLKIPPPQKKKRNSLSHSHSVYHAPWDPPLSLSVNQFFIFSFTHIKKPTLLYNEIIKMCAQIQKELYLRDEEVPPASCNTLPIFFCTVFKLRLIIYTNNTKRCS